MLTLEPRERALSHMRHIGPAPVNDRPAQDGERDSHSAAEAFDRLFQDYEQKIFNLILRLVGDYEEAADLTAETFVRAMRAYHRFRHEARPSTWLYRIALNLCKNYFRQQRLRRRVHAFSLDSPPESTPDSAPREIEDSTQSPEHRFAARELQEHIANCLLQLRPEFRTLIVLRDVQGLSYQEIAAALGCSEKAVKSRLFRARTQLRQALDPYLSGQGPQGAPR